MKVAIVNTTGFGDFRGYEVRLVVLLLTVKMLYR